MTNPIFNPLSLFSLCYFTTGNGKPRYCADSSVQTIMLKTLNY